jgi:osmoprotectant transport system permease protein
VGSKTFTESVILGDIVTQIIGYSGMDVRHREELGGTQVLWSALLNHDIDIYPEYTGTIEQEILSGHRVNGLQSIRRILGEKGVLVSDPLGFNNTYVLGMKKEKARELGVEKISDLKDHPELRLGFSNEFMDRKDGWPTLQRTYELPQKNVRGLTHDLAYRGLDSGSIDVIDLYATDAEIEYYDLKTLEDDKGHFPDYKAVFLYRKDFAQNNPEVMNNIFRLEGKIDEEEMSSMNAMVKIEGDTESRVASQFLGKELSIETTPDEESFLDRLVRNTTGHITLVLISLGAAIFISVPLGVAAYKTNRFQQIILGTVGIIQTLPSLALFVFMIPFFGIGTIPAICALFLYSLLPIVRNTFSGLQDIPADIRESAEALGLTNFQILRLVEIPLATRSILSGIKTSAVINVGTATLGALIGSGGYGQPILTGIRLDDMSLIMEGAVPAAILALMVQGLFDLIEYFVIPEELKSVSG